MPEHWARLRLETREDEVIVNLDERGWMDAHARTWERVERLVIEPLDESWVGVAVPMPPCTSAVYYSKVYGQVSGGRRREIRIYRIGYMEKGHEFGIWAYPDGTVEGGGDEPTRWRQALDETQWTTGNSPVPIAGASPEHAGNSTPHGR